MATATQPLATVYTASATATSGREGHVKTNDGAIDLELSMPKAVGGAGGVGANPEQLFASAYAACFGSAARAAAQRQHLDVRSSTITARVSLGRREDGTFGLSVELIGGFPGLSHDQAMMLMNAAHELCPYSRATRGNVDVQLSVQ
jgi:osmotically inducible protein OsmC